MGPKTEGLIANGDWCHVKAEYLNHGDYINCVSRGIPGVCTRMDWNAAQFQSMCKHQLISNFCEPYSVN